MTVSNKLKSSIDLLRALAIVFKHMIRMKIVAELYCEAMSAKDFLERFGGGSLQRVAQHFEVLEKWGWIRCVGFKLRSQNRRGRSEKLYRATMPAFLDNDTWSLLPYSVRLAFSWCLFKATAQELCAGFEHAVEHGRSPSEMTCVQLTLDAPGWSEGISLLDSNFDAIFEEQSDSRLRVEQGSGQLSRLGVMQIGFESPSGKPEGTTELAGVAFPPMKTIFERLVPIFEDEIKIKIITELNKRPMSVKVFAREFYPERSEWVIRNCFRQLEKLGWITIVESIVNRGTLERFFRATKPLTTSDSLLPKASKALADTASWKELTRLSELVEEGVSTGSFDERDDRHISWSIVYLDEQGWKNVLGGLEQCLSKLRAIENDARARIEAGAEPVTMTVAMGAVESPVGLRKVP